MKTRTDYTHKLDTLKTLIKQLSDQVVDDIRSSATALSGNKVAAASVVASGAECAKLVGLIESSCMDCLLLQQPVAGDLRFLSGSFRMVSDLRRIGDMARDVVALSGEVAPTMPSDVSVVVSRMALLVATMVDDATRSFIIPDVDLAHSVFAGDDAVDELYDKAASIVVDLIRNDESQAKNVPELLMVAKYYERMGDHTQRIADWSIFRDTGEHGGVEID